MICITGIPGAGKTTICRKLSASGIECFSVLDLPGSETCKFGEEVDIDCLKEKFAALKNTNIVVEGHYSHLLGCNSVILLDRDETAVYQELSERGYSFEKIQENVDSLRSDIIYQEALELLPSTRIHRVKVEEGRPEAVFDEIVNYIKNQKTNLKES